MDGWIRLAAWLNVKASTDDDGNLLLHFEGDAKPALRALEAEVIGLRRDLERA